MNDHRPWVELVDSPIDLEAYQDAIADPDTGAHGWFIGVTRRTTGRRVTETLTYQAHDAMALRELEKLGAAAIEEFALCKLLIVHRLGEVPVGHASVLIGCSSSHRVATFQALPWIMDRLKRDVPIWKREVYADGTTEWVHPITDESSA